MLPETGEVTFIEATLFASIGMIFIYLAESIFVLKLVKRHKIKLAERIDKYSAIGALGLYILSFIFIVWYFFY
jgi:amino acid transporter